MIQTKTKQAYIPGYLQFVGEFGDLNWEATFRNHGKKSMAGIGIKEAVIRDGLEFC